jgi:hypothetical protein
VAAYAEVVGDGMLSLTGLVAAADGSGAVRVSGVGDQPQSLGARLAQQAVGQGAGAWLR